MVNNTGNIDMSSRDIRKREAFIKLAEGRTNKAIDCIRKIGSLSNRGNYSYDNMQVNKIIAALKEAVSSVENQFKRDGSKKPRFKLQED